ncbi:hypothetical protein AGR4C_pa60040 [Agrobacterium tumefaciens str. Kerr 14]|uniref:F-box domain-containing protein n=1 Tax=Agrobacterium tumefaciens str. Kerr 14 TaxID=1183424 RepID=A0A1S7SB80_AGRTU|nr:F-box protein [Agrobacterium tumefaciens]CUX65942.1 hypothetical protein AGR4C_pa60040 [Agrobacterium tumefaciens str. Kerr 14]
MPRLNPAANEDPVARPVRSNKRKAPDFGEADAKRPRYAEGSLNNLPTELQVEVLRNLMVPDERDPLKTVRDLASLRRVNRSSRDLIELEIGDGKFVDLIRNIGVARWQLLKIIDPKEVEGKSRFAKAETIPWATPEQRSLLVSNIVRPDRSADFGDLTCTILNLDYLERSDRSRVQLHVCHLARTGPAAWELVKGLIEKSEHLDPADRSNLLKATFDLENPDARRDCLGAWAARCGRLDGQQQRSLLYAARNQASETAFTLGAYAHNLEQLEPANRRLLIEQILTTAPERPGRLWALSGLVSKLDVLVESGEQIDEYEKVRVANEVIAGLTHGPHEPAMPGPEHWMTDPELCQREAAHQLKSRPELLEQYQIAFLHSYVKGHLESGNDADLPSQVQLLPHMQRNQREHFVEQALRRATGDDDLVWGPTLDERVALALALREKDLEPAEREHFVNYISDVENSCAYLEEAVRHVANTGLDRFSPEQRTRIVEERLFTFQEKEAADASLVLGDVVVNARQLTSEDIAMMSKAVRALTVSFRVDENVDKADPNVRSLTARAARAVTVWTQEAVHNAADLSARSKLREGQSGIVTQLDDLENPSVAARGYDHRSNDTRGR